jgi:GDP-L-fucose synthase
MRWLHCRLRRSQTRCAGKIRRLPDFQPPRVASDPANAFDLNGKHLTSPAIAAWSAAPSFGRLQAEGLQPTWSPAATPNSTSRSKPLCDAFFRSERIDLGLSRGRQGRWHPRQQHLPRRIHLREPGDPEQRDPLKRWQFDGTKKLLFPGLQSCIYPRDCPQPIKEEYLLTGPLEPTNEPYAIAKIAGIKMCESYNRQYGTDYRSVMPCNLYGPGDNYNLANSHVIPAMIRKFHLAKLAQERNLNAIIADQQRYGEIPPETKAMIGLDAEAPITVSSNISPKALVQLWGTGKPLREFLHVDDLAEAAIFVMNLDAASWLTITRQQLSHLNVGFGFDYPINSVASIVADTIGYKGHCEFDASKPDGTPRKLMSSKLMTELGWQAKIPLAQGIHQTYASYRHAFQ